MAWAGLLCPFSRRDFQTYWPTPPIWVNPYVESPCELVTSGSCDQIPLLKRFRRDHFNGQNDGWLLADTSMEELTTKGDTGSPTRCGVYVYLLESACNKLHWILIIADSRRNAPWPWTRFRWLSMSMVSPSPITAKRCVHAFRPLHWCGTASFKILRHAASSCLWRFSRSFSLWRISVTSSAFQRMMKDWPKRSGNSGWRTLPEQFLRTLWTPVSFPSLGLLLWANYSIL